MSVLRPCLVLLVVTLLVTPVLGVNPVDDDAGTGGDAGDTFETATPIVPGSYTGRLTATVDTADRYRFTAEAGDVFKYDWAAPRSTLQFTLHGPGFDGEPYREYYNDPFGNHDEWPVAVPVPRSGEWVLSFSLRGHVEGAITYAFTFELTPPASFHTLVSEAGGVVTEMSLEEFGDLTFKRNMEYVAYDSDRPPMAIGLLQWGLEGGNGSRGTIMTGWTVYLTKHTGFGDRIVVPLAGDPIPFPVLQFETGDRRTFGFHIENVRGSFRTVDLHAYAQGYADIAVSATVPVTFGVAERSPMVWSSLDHIEDGDTLTPVYADWRGGSFDLAIDGAYFGYFHPGDASGRVVAPNGTAYDVGWRGHWFQDPAPGDWTLEVGPWSGLREGPVQTYFLGAHLPYLGIWPSGTCPHHAC